MDKLKKETYMVMFVQAVLYTAMSSTVILSAIKEASELLYNTANLLGLAGGATILYYLRRESNRTRMLKYAYSWLVAELAIMSILTIMAIQTLELRYIASIVIYPMFSDIRKCIIEDIRHRYMSEAVLTNYSAEFGQWLKLGTVSGFGLAILLPTLGYRMSLEVGIALAIMANILTFTHDCLWVRYDRSQKAISNVGSEVIV